MSRALYFTATRVSSLHIIADTRSGLMEDRRSDSGAIASRPSIGATDVASDRAVPSIDAEMEIDGVLLEGERPSPMEHYKATGAKRIKHENRVNYICAYKTIHTQSSFPHHRRSIHSASRETPIWSTSLVIILRTSTVKRKRKMVCLWEV